MDWPTVADHLVTQLPAIIAAIGAVLAVVFAARAAKSSNSAAQGVAAVATSIDGVKDELMAATAGRSHAEGVIAGTAAEKAATGQATTLAADRIVEAIQGQNGNGHGA